MPLANMTNVSVELSDVVLAWMMKDASEASEAQKQQQIAQLEHLLSKKLFSNANAEHLLDMRMTNKLAPLSSQVIKNALPSGLERKFPLNQMSLMTNTGAKASVDILIYASRSRRHSSS